MGTVTILTDAIADPNSAATRAINELAREVGTIRALPIAGHGAAANVRDLLHLRGVDFAVLNSDILTFLDRAHQHPDARKQIRYVTHMFSQKVYLLVRKDIGKIEDLRGRSVAVLSRGTGSHTTAITLFWLLGIDAAVHPLGSDAQLDDATLEKHDGALLLSEELARVQLNAQARADLRVLPINLAPPLRESYQEAMIEPQELPGVPVAGSMPTIAVSTLLAVYNWRSPQKRHADVAQFTAGLLAAFPRLRQNAGSVWRQADVTAKIDGWSRYGLADPVRALGKEKLAQLAAVEPPPVALPSLGTAPAETSKIRVLAIDRAPLADEQMPEGGLIPELLRSSLSKARLEGKRSDIELRWATEAPVKSLLSDASIDISLPWDGADCERPGDLDQLSAVLCDNALYSDAILEVVVGLFTRSESSFKFDTDESIFGKTICISGDQDVSLLNGRGRNWLSQKRVTAVRQPTLLDCASAVQTLAADALVASDLEGRYVIDRLGLSHQFRMAERPLGIRGIHAVVSKQHAQSAALIDALNRGLRELKASDTYASILRSHLMRLWSARADRP